MISKSKLAVIKFIFGAFALLGLFFAVWNAFILYKFSEISKLSNYKLLESVHVRNESGYVLDEHTRTNLTLDISRSLSKQTSPMISNEIELERIGILMKYLDAINKIKDLNKQMQLDDLKDEVELATKDVIDRAQTGLRRGLIFTVLFLIPYLILLAHFDYIRIKPNRLSRKSSSNSRPETIKHDTTRTFDE